INLRRITANSPPANAGRLAVAPVAAWPAVYSRTPALPAVPSAAVAEAAHDSPVAADSVGAAFRRSSALDTPDEPPHADRQPHRLRSVPGRDRSAAALRGAAARAARSAAPRRAKSATSR